MDICLVTRLSLLSHISLGIEALHLRSSLTKYFNVLCFYIRKFYCEISTLKDFFKIEIYEI